MFRHTKLYGAIAGAIVVVVLGMAAFTTNEGVAGGEAGALDDGKELLSKAGITLDAAIAAAQGSAVGDIGEVDLEYWHGTLIFNVDVGDFDVKVDAATGAVIGKESDD